MEQPAPLRRKRTDTTTTTRKAARRLDWTANDDALLLQWAPDWKGLLPLMPERTHASLACRYKRLLDNANPERKKVYGTGKYANEIKRRQEKRRVRQLTAAVNENGVFVAVSNTVDRVIFNILRMQRDLDYAKDYQADHRDDINARRHHLRQTNPRWRMEANLRSRLADYVRTEGLLKKATTEKLLSMDWDRLFSHMHSQLRAG